MRLLLLALLIGLSAPAGFAQNDTTKTTRTGPTPQTDIPVPGVNSPISAPGTLMQSSPRPNAVPEQSRGRKRRLRTNPPSDPRAFGVSIPLEGTKKDSLKNPK